MSDSLLALFVLVILTSEEVFFASHTNYLHVVSYQKKRVLCLNMFMRADQRNLEVLCRLLLFH